MSLRVMTWNLWWHFGPWEARQRLIVDTIREVDPDVLCVQEVWSDEAHDQLDDLASALDFRAARTEPIFYSGQSFGNAVLSRWPVDRLADEVLPRADGSPSHRRVVAASIETPFGPWPFASTHLDHRFDRSADRVAQIRRVMELAREWRGDPDEDVPVIVGADLNAVPDTDEIRMATGRTAGVDGIVFSDTWEQAGSGSGHTWLRECPYSADSAWPDRRLDYVLVSWPRPKPIGNPIRTWTVGHGGDDDVWPSDHLAVVADVSTGG
ncbi:endonuclease/exonuclease/phosphatase family protein [Ilumatobacter nonamiensis]|uniref:endonuclease/exonuclease/phosphatase family protein n=1 Tax=Ilumatobacter nonamiensis TaxID=467093 RepID=UPI0005903788|nr:endonuclease/exonuclease/phosphatase family protein [Ilumatobacter nonamiensis]